MTAYRAERSPILTSNASLTFSFVAWKLLCLGTVFALGEACASDNDPATSSSNGTSAASGTGGVPAIDNWDIAQQNQRLGRALNLGNCLDAPKEGDWGAVLTKQDFVQAAALGFDSVRVPVRWSAHVAAEPPYAIDEGFLERVDWAVAQALSNHLRAVVDVHHFVSLMAQPAQYADVLTSIWKQLAEHYKNYGPELYFELLNEPTGEVTAALWNAWAPQLISTIRESNPKRSIIVGGVGNSIGGLLGLELSEDPYLIGTFHFYDPQQFAFQGLDSSLGTGAPGGKKWYGSESDVSVINAQFQQVVDWQTRHGRPILLGEFGTSNLADIDSRVRYTAYIADYASSRGWSYAIWDNHGDMAIRNQATGEVYQGIIDALMRPKETFEATRVALPPVTLPTGPSVLIDDFEDALGDRPDQTFVMSAKASVTGSTADHSEWSCSADPTTNWVGVNDAPLVTYEMAASKNLKTNMHDAVGNVGFAGKGLRFAGQLGGNSSYASVGVGLQGQFGVDWLDLTALTALSFRAKGTGVMRMMLVSDYCLNHYAAGQNWGQIGMDFTLDSDWSQFVLNVADFDASPWSPAAQDGVTWAKVRDRITYLAFGFSGALAGPVEVYLDDVRLHGIGYDAFGFNYSEP